MATTETGVNVSLLLNWSKSLQRLKYHYSWTEQGYFGISVWQFSLPSPSLLKLEYDLFIINNNHLKIIFNTYRLVCLHFSSILKSWKRRWQKRKVIRVPVKKNHVLFMQHNFDLQKKTHIKI